MRVADYATPGSHDLAERVRAALTGRSAALLQNHGTLTVGPSLGRAYRRSVLLEWLAATYHRARLVGDPSLIDDEELARVGRLLGGYFDRDDR